MATPDKDARLILWNHRWEYDKAPDLFADAILAAAEKGADFRQALLGKRTPSSALARLRDWLSVGLPGPVDASTWYVASLDGAWRYCLAEGQKKHVE
jgi:hypothetical protein